MKKKFGLTAIGLMLVLSLIGTHDAGAATAATDAEDTTTTTEAPPTTEAPTTTEAPPSTEAPPTTEAPAPTTTAAPSSETTEREPRVRSGPDPRWVNYRCGSGITACHMAKHHQANGRFQWRNGHWFQWGTAWVRGHRSATWPAFQREARLLKIYLYVAAVNRHRQQLVNRWSGVAQCESGGNWRIATGNGYYGGLQFNLGTWRAYGGTGTPNKQPAWYQATIAERVRVRSGLHHWPHCGRYYG